MTRQSSRSIHQGGVLDRQASGARKAAILDRVRAGVSARDIAAEFGITPGAVNQTAREAGVVRPRKPGHCPCGRVLERGQVRDCRACVDDMLAMWRADLAVPKQAENQSARAAARAERWRKAAA